MVNKAGASGANTDDGARYISDIVQYSAEEFAAQLGRMEQDPFIREGLLRAAARDFANALAKEFPDQIGVIAHQFNALSAELAAEVRE